MPHVLAFFRGHIEQFAIVKMVNAAVRFSENVDGGDLIILGVLGGGAIGVGMLIAPGAAGWLAAGQGYGPVILFGVLTLGASLVAFITAQKLEKRRPEPIIGEDATLDQST